MTQEDQRVWILSEPPSSGAVTGKITCLSRGPFGSQSETEHFSADDIHQQFSTHLVWEAVAMETWVQLLKAGRRLWSSPESRTSRRTWSWNKNVLFSLEWNQLQPDGSQWFYMSTFSFKTYKQTGFCCHDIKIKIITATLKGCGDQLVIPVILRLFCQQKSILKNINFIVH